MLTYSWAQIAAMNGAQWLQSASFECIDSRHVCVASPDSGECRTYRRPISRAKLFITEVHIRTSGRPTLQARLGGNYHFLWHRTQTAFEKWFLLRSDATETFRIRRPLMEGKINATVSNNIAFELLFIVYTKIIVMLICLIVWNTLIIRIGTCLIYFFMSQKV